MGHDAGAMDGEADAWAVRALGHTDALLRFARAFTPDAAAAEDLVQEAIVRAYRARGQFRGEASELTWLRSILRNLAIDRARRPVREVSVEEVELDWQDDAYTVDAGEVVALAEEREELLDALSRLSHAYRTVVVLHDVEGWTVAEVAEALDIGLPAAKQRLRRGRMALVSALADGRDRRLGLTGVPLRCWDARRHVSDYLDDALEPEVRSAVQAHVERCPTCPALVAALVGATAALGQVRDPDTVVAPDLAARIRAQLSPEPTAPASAPPD
jgi:RNA polymerase sigma-70 factor (ECF subfamily)